MAWYDYVPYVSPIVNTAKGNNPLEKAWEWGTKKPTADQMDQNPYMGNYGSLIGQLSQQPGPGQSLAGMAYTQANQTGMKNVLAMSRGGSAGAARQGMQTYGAMQQGQKAGYANAALQEELARRQSLMQALSGASQAWFQPNYANLQAKMGTQNNMQMLSGVLGQLGGSIGTIAGGK